MSINPSELAVEIAVANLDLYPYMPGRPDWGSNYEQLVPFLQETGIRNYEIHPSEQLVEESQDSHLAGDMELINRLTGSLYQTFSSGKDFFGRTADWRGIMRSKDSIEGLLSIQSTLDNAVPSVIYPVKPSDILNYSEYLLHNADNTYRGTYPVFQPTAELYNIFETQKNGELLYKVSEQGITGFCPDTFHARANGSDGTPPPPIEETWVSQFRSGKVYQIHLSTDRLDLKKRDPDLFKTSVQEYKAFTSSSEQSARLTQMGEMIISAIENWQPPNEFSPVAGKFVLRAVIKMPPWPTRLHRTRDHAQMAKNIAEIVRETGATPLLWQE